MKLAALLSLGVVIGGCALASDLDAVLEPGTELKRLATNFKFTEGPVWNSAGGFWIFSDIPANLLYKCTPAAEVEIFRSPSGESNGNTLDREGRLVTCEHANRRVSRTEKDGTVATLADRWEGKRFNSPNDLAVKSDGSIYFTDPDYGTPKSEARETEFCGVYRLMPDGKVTLLVKDFVKPNGIAFSPDEKRLYINDSDVSQQHMRVFDVQPDGSLANGRIFADMKKPRGGVPDGMKVDSQGNVYSSGSSGVWIFAPDGKQLGIIEMPQMPANLCFGGADGKTLFITAQTSVYTIRVKIAGDKW